MERRVDRIGNTIHQKRRDVDLEGMRNGPYRRYVDNNCEVEGVMRRRPWLTREYPSLIHCFRMNPIIGYVPGITNKCVGQRLTCQWH